MLCQFTAHEHVAKRLQDVGWPWQDLFRRPAAIGAENPNRQRDRRQHQQPTQRDRAAHDSVTDAASEKTSGARRRQ